MEIYFASMSNLGENPVPRNLVAFTIPDIGVKFKAPFKAENITLDYVSLLTLLEFIEVNPQLFANRALELYCNNFDLIEQVEKCRVNDPDLIPLLEKAIDYRHKLKYSLNWIPDNDNPASRLEID